MPCQLFMLLILHALVELYLSHGYSEMANYTN